MNLVKIKLIKMDFCEEQYDLLGLGYYRGVISHKEILYEQDHFRVDQEMFGEQNAIFKI